MTSRIDAPLFRRLGWLWIRGFFDASTAGWLRTTVGALGAEAESLLRRGGSESATGEGDGPPAATSELIVVPEAGNPAIVCRYEGVLAARPSLRERLLPLVLPLVDHLGGEPFHAFKDKVNNKYPGGGAYRPHQDIVAYRTFGPRYHVTAMITIDAGTLENGCLQIADDYRAFLLEHPESVSYRIGDQAVLPSHEGGASHGDIREEIANRLPWRPLETQPGDLVLLDSFVPHHSERNRSSSPRRALFITFSALREGDWYDRYYEAKRKDPLDPRFHVSTPTRLRD